MATPAIRIRVGASLDANTSNVFKPLIDAARAARQAVEDEMDRMHAAINGKGAGAGKGGPYRGMVRDAERAGDRILDVERKKQSRIAAEEAKALRRRESAEKYVARIKDKHFREEQKRSEKADRASSKEGAKGASRREEHIRAIAGGTKENLKKIGSGALGVGGAIARGAGVKTDLAGYVADYVELETRATELSSAAYDPSKGRGSRIDPKRLMQVGRDVGAKTGFGSTEVLGGLQSFVGATGDLATGQAALPELAELARATGTSLEDMVGAAGKAALALGEVGPGKEFENATEKGKALVDVLRLLAGQGKVGSVELKDLAAYGGRLSAAAPKFGKDASRSMGYAGALAQLSVQRGGAVGPAEAAQSVSGFLNTLKTPARMKEFEGKGVNIRGDIPGTFREIPDILKDAAAAANGNVGDWKKMFANVQGGKAADPAFDAYNKAYAEGLKTTKDKTKAEKAGRKAIDDMFEAFGKPITAEEQADSFGAQMNTTAVKTQLLNNQFSEIAGKMAQKVIPELEKLAPAALGAASAFSNIVKYSVDNPVKAAAAAVGVSIAKAGIDQVVKVGVDKAINMGASSIASSKGLATAAAVIAIGTVGVMTIDMLSKQEGEGVNKSVEADVAAGNALSMLKTAQWSGVKGQGQEALAAGGAQAAALEQRITQAQDPTSFLGALFGSKTFEQRSKEQADAEKLPQLKEDLAALKAEMAKVAGALKGPLNVQGTVNVGNNAPGPTPNVGATTK